MVYKGCDYEYANQVTAEHKVNEKKNGVTRQVWKKKHSHGDNHYLDAEVYAMTAADVMGARTLHLQNQDEDVPKRQNSAQNETETQEEQWIRANEGWLRSIK